VVSNETIQQSNSFIVPFAKLLLLLLLLPFSTQQG
jgi:hypothetical protein